MSTVNLIADTEIVPVKNMMGHEVGYTTLSGVTRRFAPHMTNNIITAGELRELSYMNGGLDFLTNYVQVLNSDLAQEFGISDDDVEYNWTEEDIVAALTTSDIDVLLDALDFGPEGIVEELKNKAIELEITDGSRIQAINKRTGVDINGIIKNKHAYDEATETEEEETPKKRRTSTKSTSTSGRRRSTSTAKKTTTTSKKKTSTKKTAAAKTETVEEVAENAEETVEE